VLDVAEASVMFSMSWDLYKDSALLQVYIPALFMGLSFGARTYMCMQGGTRGGRSDFDNVVFGHCSA
jgi:hypothetical protein